MQYIDAHCHLQLPPLYDVADQVASRAIEAAVQKICVNATREEDWPAVEQLAEKCPQVIVPSFGVHPWYAGETTDGWIDRLRDILQKWPRAAVGEAGLCRSAKGKSVPGEIQDDVCLQQIKLARELGRPISLHCVQRHGRLLELLESVVGKGKQQDQPWVLLHAYSGTADMVKPFAKVGAMFSICGAVTHPHADKMRAAVSAISVDRLLLETDSPDQLPLVESLPALPPLPGTQDTQAPPNEPAYITVIAAEVARVKNMSVEDVVAASTANARRLFGIDLVM